MRRGADINQNYELQCMSGLLAQILALCAIQLPHGFRSLPPWDTPHYY
jgi:hypothetical protein